MADLRHEQIQLPFMTEVVQDVPQSTIDWERKITLRRLVWEIAGEEQLTTDYVTEPDLAYASPIAIESGLYIRAGDPRFETAEDLVTISSKFATETAKQALHDEKEGKRPKVPPIHTGVVFPSEQYGTIGHYSKALGRRTRSKTRSANRTNPDRDEVRERSGRTAGHTLQGYIEGMGAVQGQLLSERMVLMSLYRDLTTPIWQARFKACNLDKRRREADETIHATAEVASINLNLGTVAINGLHRAIRANLYRRGTQDELTQHWFGYILMAGRYANARSDRLTSLIAASQDELLRYQPFLDRKQAE